MTAKTIEMNDILRNKIRVTPSGNRLEIEFEDEWECAGMMFDKATLQVFIDRLLTESEAMEQREIKETEKQNAIKYIEDSIAQRYSEMTERRKEEPTWLLFRVTDKVSDKKLEQAEMTIIDLATLVHEHIEQAGVK